MIVAAGQGLQIWEGGPLVWLLLLCSVFSVGIFLERYLHFHRSRVAVSDLLQGIGNLVRRKSYAEALHECAGTPGPVARVVHSAILRHNAPRSELKEIVQEAGQLEVPQLERNLAVLRNLAYITPLIGLLGTILGLLKTFVQISQNSGFTTSAEISEGLYESLITSAVGIVVAIPAFTFYSYLAAFAKSLMHDMERGGIEIVNIICDERREKGEIIDFHHQSDSPGGPEPSGPPVKTTERMVGIVP